jgi:hypothetical protein
MKTVFDHGNDDDDCSVAFDLRLLIDYSVHK